MSFEIHLEGLTDRQMILADLIWSCRTREAIDELVRSMPSQDLMDEARSIVELMILATVDECYDGRGSLDEARDVIYKVKQLPKNC